MKELRIGNKVAKVPIIQGGMGVGVSRGKLAGAVAKEGALALFLLHRLVMIWKDLKKIKWAVMRKPSKNILQWQRKSHREMV